MDWLLSKSMGKSTHSGKMIYQMRNDSEINRKFPNSQLKCWLRTFLQTCHSQWWGGNHNPDGDDNDDYIEHGLWQSQWWGDSYKPGENETPFQLWVNIGFCSKCTCVAKTFRCIHQWIFLKTNKLVKNEICESWRQKVHGIESKHFRLTAA